MSVTAYLGGQVLAAVIVAGCLVGSATAAIMVTTARGRT
jgi:hypothetical protein